MKKSVAILLVTAMAAGAETWYDSWMENTSSVAQEICNNWRHEMPETGMMPSYIYAEFSSNMGERHGGSRFGWRQVGLNVPFADPRRSGGEEWMFNASLNAEMTVMSTRGALDFRKDEFYHISLPVSAIIPEQNGNTYIFALAPSLASDFVRTSHSFHLNLLASYNIKHSDIFSYSVGLAYAPVAGVWSLLPVVSCTWQMSDDWTFELKGYKISFMADMGQGWRTGVFAQACGGSWAVDTPQGTRLLRVRSLVAGVTAEYDFSKPGQTKRIATLSLGSTLATTVDISRFNSDRDREQGHHYHPGLYVSGAVDFRF